jgi:hypothetical protein
MLVAAPAVTLAVVPSLPLLQIRHHYFTAAIEAIVVVPIALMMVVAEVTT